jgi:hypothetical protein
MILDLVAIFRARRDPRLAARLAARFAQDQAIERVTAPLFIAHIVLWAIIGLCALFILGLAVAALSLHWTLALPALIPFAIGGVAIVLERGLRRGMARVRNIAGQLTDRGMDRLIQNPKTGEAPTSSPPLREG